MNKYKLISIILLITVVILSIFLITSPKNNLDEKIVKEFQDSIKISDLISLGKLLINRIEYKTFVNEIENNNLILFPLHKNKKVDTLKLELNFIELYFKNDSIKNLIDIKFTN